jgi:hypothetical protein
MANRHNKEICSEYRVDLAELCPLRLPQVAGQPKHHQERIAVALDFGPLIGLDGVLNRQLL